jgi:hypothetical protein
MKKVALLAIVSGLVLLGCYPQRKDTTDPNDPKAPKAPKAGEKTGASPGIPAGPGPGIPGSGMPKPGK